MITIPLQVNPAQYDLFIILEDENIERIKKYDPAEVVGKNLPPQWSSTKIRNIMILYANAEEVKRLALITDTNDAVNQLKELSRGWKYKPEEGDNDEPYQSPRKN